MTASTLAPSNKAMLTPPKDMSESQEPLAAAPGGWFTCTVTRAGPAEEGTMFIGLKGPFGVKWFSAHPNVKREMLATALAAMSMGNTVIANLTTTDEYGVINRLYRFIE